MGLLYALPISKEDKDFYQHDQRAKVITLKSYGLPYIFWGYGLAASIVIFFMLLAIRSPLYSLLQSSHAFDKTLAISFIIFFIGFSLACFAFFFYQKRVLFYYEKKLLKIRHFVAGIPLRTEKIQGPPLHFKVEHFLDSPNYARLHHQEGMEKFKNRGYFTLKVSTDNKSLQVDRSSRKNDLLAIEELLKHS